MKKCKLLHLKKTNSNTSRTVQTKFNYYNEYLHVKH